MRLEVEAGPPLALIDKSQHVVINSERRRGFFEVKTYSFELYLKSLFGSFSRDEMRIMWDNCGDNSFFGPYDCADIHAWMNIQGDGEYCAV